MIQEAEREAERPDWRSLGVVTNARAKRMADVQFLSELMLVTLEGRIIGFDQDALDEFYAKYDDPLDSEAAIDTMPTRARLSGAEATC